MPLEKDSVVVSTVSFEQGIDEEITLLAIASLLMGYIQGEGRNQGTLFPVVLDDFVPSDHVGRGGKV
jgi:hypothetical protein